MAVNLACFQAAENPKNKLLHLCKFIHVHCIQGRAQTGHVHIELEYRNVGVWEEGKTRILGEKTSRTNDENQ